MTGRVVTFYSYKGGVGRSFLLANTAVWMARSGFRVLCVDWDLEAPGLFHYLNENGLLVPGRRAGLVELFTEIRSGRHPDWRRLIRETGLGDVRGHLHLLDAGDASSDDYGRRLAQIDWEGDYEAPDVRLGERIEQLRREWVRDYDFVLVDSRTGLTDIGGICTAQLPDLVVLVFAPNVQGLQGTLDALRKAHRQRSLLPLDRGDFAVLPIPSRFDPNAVGADLDKWTRVLAERLQPVYDEWRDKKVPVERLGALLRVPHVARWSLGEPLPMLQESSDDPSSVSYSIATIGAFLARGLEDSAALVDERNVYVRDVVRKNRSLLGPDGAAAPDFAYPYDLFLSFSGPDREFARALARELSDRGRRVFFDEESITKGDRWAVSLQTALRDARALVALVGEEISAWQRAEVEAFESKLAASPERVLIPVLRGPRPDWPKLFALQGFEVPSGSPAEVASALHRTLTERDRPQRGDARSAPDDAPRIWSEAEALSNYRALVARQHEKLIPYFRGAADLLLDETYVEIELEPTRSREDLGVGEAIGNKRGPGDTGARSLAELLKPAGAGAAAPRWIVVGEPGAGKTTLVRSYARTAARGAELVPVFVPLARVSRSVDPLAFAVADMLGEDGPRSPNGAALLAALAAAEASGALLVLFDGLDEVDPKRMDQVFADVSAYVEAHPAAAVVLTSRPIALERRDIPKRFSRARAQPLPPERQNELLSKLLGAAEGARVRTHIEAHPALGELAANPLLLTLLAVVARDTVLAEATLPSTRSKLYETAVDLLLRRGFGVEKHGVRDTEPARRLLRKLSLHLHTEGGESWERKALSESLTAIRRGDEAANFDVKETWGSNDEFLDDIGTNSGVLGPHDGPTAPWRYLHRSLREYLVAEAIASETSEQLQRRVGEWARETEAWKKAEAEAKKSSTPPSKPSGANPARWGEVFALLCGMRKSPSSLLDAICKASADVALRTLPSIDALPPSDVLDRYLRVEGWAPEQLLMMLKRWNLAEPRAAALVDSKVSADLSTESLGRIWFVLETLGAAPVRESFLPRCGRPLPETDIVPWVRIPAGRFRMGSDRTGDPDERPAHEVVVSALAIAAMPVTRGQYRLFDKAAQFYDGWDDPEADDDELPATDRTWFAARLFCVWIGARLPSEAEWEYACRAGTSTEYSFGDSHDCLDRYGWFFNNSGQEPIPLDTEWSADAAENCRLRATRKKLPNPWGLFDMHGNVWEWCEDRWHSSYDGAPTDGSAWTDGPSGYRVVRGGSYWNSAEYARSASRGSAAAADRGGDVGFRPAKSVTP